MLLVGSRHGRVMLLAGAREIVLGLLQRSLGLPALVYVQSPGRRAGGLAIGLRGVAFLPSGYHGSIRDRRYDGVDDALPPGPVLVGLLTGLLRGAEAALHHTG